MLVFCETTEFADKVTETIGKEAFSYHTKSPDKKQMKENLKLFKENKKFRVVSAVKAIEEGLDVENLECVVLVSGNSTKRQYIQRIGRSLRTYKDKVAIIINIYIHGTQDETWLRKRQSSNRINILWVNDVEQIKGYINSYLNKPAGSVQHDNLGDEHPQGTETPLYTL
jgi:superfamily II DNA or RNA helicase